MENLDFLIFVYTKQRNASAFLFSRWINKGREWCINPAHFVEIASVRPRHSHACPYNIQKVGSRAKREVRYPSDTLEKLNGAFYISRKPLDSRL